MKIYTHRVGDEMGAGKRPVCSEHASQRPVRRRKSLGVSCLVLSTSQAFPHVFIPADALNACQGAALRQLDLARPTAGPQPALEGVECHWRRSELRGVLIGMQLLRASGPLLM